MEIENRKLVTNHLLDIDKFNGRFEGRSSRAIIFIVFMGAPLLLLWGVIFQTIVKYGIGIALLIMLPLYTIYGLVVAAYVLLHQAERMKQYKRRQEKKYDDISEIVRLKNIRADGCVEYFNGDIAYMVACYNGNVETTAKFYQIKDFLESINAMYTLHIMIQNLSDTSQLEEYYPNVGKFKDKEVAAAYLKIIDQARKDIESSSLVVRIVYAYHTRATERVLLKRALENALPKKAYFECHIANRKEALDILGHEIGTTINIESMIMNRFAKGKYYKSKVLAYSVDDNNKVVRKRARDREPVTAFLRKKG